MQPEFISRVVGLVQKNGDRVILADPQTGKAVVVLDLESYERLCDASPAVGETPATLPFQTPKMSLPNATKIAEQSKKIDAQRKPIFTVPEASGRGTLADLTQEELLDKINRDIGVWKTAQERKRSDELVSAAQTLPRFEAPSALEEEERFYLEPIE